MIKSRHFSGALFFLLAATLIFHSLAFAAKKVRVKVPRALAPHIDYVLREQGAERGFWGIEVVRLSDGKVLYKRNEDHLFMPASNMKLITTAAALEKLGAGYVFHTTVETDSPPDAQGRIQNLILVGRGDANLGSRVLPYHLKTERRDPADLVFRELADQVAARGIREIQGDLVADDSYFVYEPYPHDWSVGDLAWGYGAPITALAFNDNELTLHVLPAGSTGTLALVSLWPISDYYRLNNHLQTVDAGAKERIHVEREPGSSQLDIWGQVALGSVVDDDTVSIEDPPKLIGEMFRKLLEAHNIKVDGHVVLKHLTRVEAGSFSDPPPSTPARVVLAEHVSLPLREDVKVTNKVSQNLHAEMLLRTLGHEAKGEGSVAGGVEALQDFMGSLGVPGEDYYFTDGSGLSRKALVAPEAVVKLLAHMAHSSNFDAYYDSLPVAGVDGTLAERLEGTSAAGEIHAKTGTITHVNALSGYMDLPSGVRLAFSIFGNAHPASARKGARAADQIALAIFQQFGGGKSVAKKKGGKKH